MKYNAGVKSKNINFNKNETESKMENPAHDFREIDLLLQFIWKIVN